MKSSGIDVLRMIYTEDGLYGAVGFKFAVPELKVENLKGEKYEH